ncbi:MULTISPECIES: ribonuclease P protein component [unclassified Polynucleobacter]|uniref:ribonuclease P protein component n=1 Tax=unclassified Polynucleobacter TaxID=2640945 RepID=UPI002573A235|nr:MULTISPECIES: ribonuclease P protein component [unclassified Polynucleobacter]
MKSARIQALLRTSPVSSGAWAIYAESKKDGIPDLGLAIAKKFAKRAVDRNRLKRVAREMTRNKTHGNFVELVIRLKKPVGGSTRGRLRNREYQALKSQLQGLVS